MHPASGFFHAQEYRSRIRWHGARSGCTLRSMITKLPTSLRACVLAFLTLALLSVPFAHRAGAAPITAQMTQFISMGGNLADICGETGDHINGGCESCQIVGAMLLSSPEQPSQAVSFQELVLTGRHAQIRADLSVQYAHPPVRGPPRS